MKEGVKKEMIETRSTVQTRLILNRSHHKRRSHTYRTLADMTSFTSGRLPSPFKIISAGFRWASITF